MFVPGALRPGPPSVTFRVHQKGNSEETLEGRGREWATQEDTLKVKNVPISPLFFLAFPKWLVHFYSLPPTNHIFSSPS